MNTEHSKERQHQRFALSCSVMVDQPMRPAPDPAMLLNISLGGALIGLCEQTPRVGRALDLEIQQPGGAPFHLPGVVVREAEMVFAVSFPKPSAALASWVSALATPERAFGETRRSPAGGSYGV